MYHDEFVRSNWMISNNFQFKLPVSICFGRNSIEKLPETCKKIGSNVLLVTSRDISHLAEKVSITLENAKINFEVFYLESSEPDCTLIDSSAKSIAEKKIDCIVGIGGGSVLDMTKSLSIAITNSEPIWMYANLSYREPKPIIKKPIPVISIPTTSGTGSEVTPYAVLTNSEKCQKGTIQQPEIFPKAAFIDPELLTTMPKELSASTGIDAFAHALESFINISKNSPISEFISIEAMKLIFTYLPKVMHEPENIEYRQKMAWASTLSGIAISHRGTTTAHAIAETLGGLIQIPHAHAVAIATYPVLKETLRYAKEQFAYIYEHIFQENSKHESNEKATAFVNSVYKLIDEVGLNRNLTDYISKIPTNFSDKLLETLLNYKYRPLRQHPKKFENTDLKKMIELIVHG